MNEAIKLIGEEAFQKKILGRCPQFYEEGFASNTKPIMLQYMWLTHKGTIKVLESLVLDERCITEAHRLWKDGLSLERAVLEAYKTVSM